MAASIPSAAQITTLALMAVAYATCEVASYLDGRPRVFGVVFGLAIFTLAILMSLFLRPLRGQTHLPRKATLLLGALLVLPLLVEPLLRSVFHDGFPLEMQLVNGLRILGILLAGLSAWPSCRRLAGVVALFLALFASAMGDQPAIPYLLAAFALTGGFWLILEYRTDDQSTQAMIVSESVHQVALRMPNRELALLAVLLIIAGGIAIAGPKRVLLNLGELMPTSGGTGETDLFARSGVGDGPEEVRGDNAQAAGMVETDKLIEDNKNSLIDAVNDMYGPPHKPNKDLERMVAAGQVEVIEFHGRLPENRRPSRDFDTGREGPKSNKKPKSEGARGVFEVEGRTPLHIRLVAYDQYDAKEHRWLEGRKPASRLFEPDHSDWMNLTNLREADWYCRDDRHRLKVADLRDNLVPTPTLLTRFRINKVDKPEYYDWEYEGVLSLSGRTRTPPGVVVTTDCRTIDLSRVSDNSLNSPNANVSVPTVLLDVPGEVRSPIQSLAREWVQGQPQGWSQIAAIRQRLRADYLHAQQVTSPAEHPAPVLWFLQDSHQGPDYLFATSAALMLRSLGYPSRVCLGYYASPEAYDPETEHTPVKVTDLHTWAEVLLKDGQWLVLETTPGYETLPPLRTYGELFTDYLLGLVQFLQRHVVLLGLIALLATGFAWQRERILDGLAMLYWQWWPWRNWRELVLQAVRVLDRRGRQVGLPRRPSQSIQDWIATWPQGRFTAKLQELVVLAEWAAYSTESGSPRPESEIREICLQALQDSSYHQIRQQFRKGND